MILLFTILIVVVCLLLTLIILVQNPKGGGLGSAFGGGGGNAQMFGGVKKTTDFLDKSTWGLAIALFVLVLSMNMFNTTSNTQASDESDMTEQVDDMIMPTQQPAPVPASAPDEDLPESVD